MTRHYQDKGKASTLNYPVMSSVSYMTTRDKCILWAVQSAKERSAKRDRDYSDVISATKLSLIQK
jgi:hypothetical protein